MYKPTYTKQFSKDVAKMKKRGKSLENLKMIICQLLEGNVLDARYKDHKLIGNYLGRRECHVENDLLLIYKVVSSEIILERLGSHSDLF